ncbi:AzlD domain-containing protein [Sansalvadorimonas verongulae]|uniref:AzlD domain-containing protein n=1 Tax=Sansalvadorimonas verongulae TaxID=2172824 RepID=UPI0012BC99F0|nr:AzlD domain-containing protein [Sansalvadorimonas verongulae]MTI14067.1 AzlD domain-containing protein [Sansalvadorimonas verongulae]
MSTATMWLVIFAGGLGTFLARYSFFWLSDRKALPKEWVRVLRFVPPGVLGALIIPGVVVPSLHSGNVLLNPRVLAALISILVAWRTKNVMITFAAGMGSLWLLQSIEPLL